MAGIAHAPVISSISSTLLRILPIGDSSQGASHGASKEVESSQDHGDIPGDNDSLSSCSSCDSSCPSYGQEMFGSYRLMKTLGVGEFGKVKLGLHPETKQKVAIKVIKKKNGTAKLIKVEREIQILKSLSHPHIVKLVEVVETDTQIGIVLEYASGGELFEYVLSHRSLDEDTAKNLFAQLISSVNHMHRMGITHRDLKLENLLFLDSQQTHLLVSDFGFANNDRKDLLSTCCGSPTYAAPELIYPSNGYRGEAADIWSCGVILYCMICGYLPFDDDPDNLEGANIHQLYRYIRSKSLSFPGFVNGDVQDLVRHMLQSDPVDRCDIDFVINHPWLHSHLSTLSHLLHPGSEQKQTQDNENHHLAAKAPLSNALQQTQSRYDGHNGHISKTHQLKENGIQVAGLHQLSTPNQSQGDSDQTQAEPYVINEETDHLQQGYLPTPTQSQTAHNGKQNHQYENGNSHEQLTVLKMNGTHTDNPMDTLPPTPMSLLSSSKMSPGTDTNNTNPSVLSMPNEKELPLLPPLPDTPMDENDAFNESGLSGQRQPSLRRQKKFRPSLTVDAFSPMANSKSITKTAANHHQKSTRFNADEEDRNIIGIRPSLLSKDDSTRYYSVMVQGGQDNIASEHTSFMNDFFNDNNGNIVQHHKTASLPLLSKAPTLAIDTTTSTTNLHGSLKAHHKGGPEIGKQRKRLTSILSLTHPRPRRTQSAHIPTRKHDKQDPSSNTSPNTPLTRKKTVTQKVKAWIHKKKPFVKHSPTSSSLSESFSSAASTGANKDHQQADTHHRPNQQMRHYLASSSSPSSLETMDAMRTMTHAQGANLTSIAPSHLILSLVRVLTALGIDVHHRSTFQLTCLRKSCHHHFWQSKHNKDVATASIYGPPELDHGHHLEFTVEICRSLLSDLYVIDMDLVAGDHSAFRFLKSKVLSLLNLKT